MEKENVMKRMLCVLVLVFALLAACSHNADVTVSGQMDMSFGYVKSEINK